MKGLPPSLMLPEMSQTKWSIMALPHYCFSSRGDAVHHCLDLLRK
jgi:hypothetical protein